MAFGRDFVSFPVLCEGNPELMFCIGEPGEEDELTKFIVKELFYRFPLKDSIDVEKEIRPWIGQYISHMCCKNYSIILRDSSKGNRIAAAAVSDVYCKNRPPADIGLHSFNDPVERPGWERICQILSDLQIGINLGQDPILHIDLVSVGEEYANRGLSSKCVRMAVRLAESRGISAMKIDAVNEFMAKASARAGFQKMNEIDYNQWEYDGEKPFATKDMVHQKARLYIYRS